MNTGPIIAEHTYATPVEDVWQAITDKDQMRQWFFEPIIEFEPEVGFETSFIVHFEGQDYPHMWTVTEIVPQERIAYRWRYGGYSGDSTVCWELEATPAGTRLRLSHSGTESFPQDNPVFSRASGQAGWDYFLHESLKNFLA